MILTKEQIDAIVAEMAKTRSEGMESIRSQVGDAFNSDNLASAIVRAEVESYANKRVQQAQRYARFVPVNTTIQADVDTAIVRGFEDFIGRGREHAGTGGDIPLAEVAYGEQKISVKRGAIGYHYSIDEMRAASRRGIGLSTAKPAAARYAYERHICDVAFFGEDKTGVKGLFNHDIPEVHNASKGWDTATNQEILNDIADAISIAFSSSDDDNLPNTIVLPAKRYLKLTSTMTGTNSDISLLSYIKRNNALAEAGVDVTILFDKGLDTAGADGGERIVIYNRDPSALELLLPEELEFLAPQPKNLDVFVPGTYLYGGVWVKSPNAIIYLDGVGG